jgi:peptidase E
MKTPPAAAVLLPALSIAHRRIPSSTSTSTFVAHRVRSFVDRRHPSSFHRRFRRRSWSSDVVVDVDVVVRPVASSRDDDDVGRDAGDRGEEDAPRRGGGDDPFPPPSSSSSRSWANRALLFSSFDDGISSNDDARAFLRHSLISAMLRERVGCIETEIRNSASFSPCNGPNAYVIDEMERVDELIERGRSLLVEGMLSSMSPSSFTLSSSRVDDGMGIDSWSNEALRFLLRAASTATGASRFPHPPPPRARVLYVPTAMYALDPNSGSTPGKQRQRARADGKKRMGKLANLLGDLLALGKERDDGIDGDVLRRISVLTSTLDLHDGSLRHHIGSNDITLFPKSDVEALGSWRPHLVYVEGGNTFWLRHCMYGGGYARALEDACCAAPADADGFGYAVYCGKSAGAILAGRNVDTATWKGWDDPTVVPDMGEYDDWRDVRGLDLVGGRSFFPHMSDDWSDVVNERSRKDDGSVCDDLVCLREHDALCVMGDEKLLLMTSGNGASN